MKRVGIIIAVIVLLLVGYLGYKQYQASKTTGTPNTISESAETVGNAVKGTIQDLLLAGKSVTCTVNDETAGGGTGIIFVSGKKMAGDFRTTVEGETTESHMITDGTYSYIWSSGQTEGVKIKVDEAKITPGASGQPGSNEAFDLKKETGLKCTPWAPDNGKFNPPTNIRFTDLSAMLKNIQQTTTTGKTTTPQGSPCDQITDAAAKAECVKALGQ
ncbi:MAG: hypothetical protein COX78_04535 [Candidatus Levybacteria bacterium CG_4_10_14_0_2_um_filter_35_8]|nr:MAG: hypothetical protein COY68_02400 [Candidatus Levybacteria bacterium CG_4_10_14_0_8_um_filter_35_23]PIZ97455.1 MAG: hypothetical protein COX78_04535 [Candidatus Levybacteria bacterium CG_4_10_14_0_2_um_filter_35_8]